MDTSTCPHVPCIKSLLQLAAREADDAHILVANRGSSTVFNVLDNDCDPENQSLSVRSVGGTFTTEEPLPLNYGRLNWTHDGRFTYHLDVQSAVAKTCMAMIGWRNPSR